MCGRFVLITAGKDLAEQFQCEQFTHLEPRYNIAPSQQIAVIRLNPGTRQRECGFVKWGLVPAWAKDPSMGSKLINARAESAREKPAFRNAFKRRRCLVIADGFYEWKKLGKGKKQPYLFGLKNGRSFAFGGLWERWSSSDGQVVESCAVLTTDSNALLEAIHDRMPVIVRPNDYAAWLDPEVQKEEVLNKILQPFPADEMEGRLVSSRVNKADYEGPDCIEPLTGEEA
ncbi:MAG TPA: SOS response-associated peptidase [Desulfomonilaceae bacterium]|nr:SOS response-associated peptidase [Desulfomonilaceae bacterium]